MPEAADAPLLADADWATVGSSNIDPLSLLLNLEANVIVHDRQFNQILTGRLDQLIEHSCREVCAADLAESSWWRVVRSFFVFYLLRLYPRVALWLPAHVPHLMPAQGLTANNTGAGARPP